MAPSKRRRQDRRPAPRAGRAHLWFAAWIVLATTASYWNSLNGPFIWDDATAIVSNGSIRTLSTALRPPPDTPTAGRPVIALSFALNYAAGGLDVFGYHVANIAIHLACALLLFGIVRRTLRDESMSSWLRESSDVIAFGAALVWAVHPLQSEAVDYITQRTESMMGLFFFLTLYSAIRGGEATARAGVWNIGAVLACGLGMATKESMIAAPVIVLLYDRAFRTGSLREALRTRTGLYVGLATTWLVLGVLMSQGARSTIGPTADVGSWTYLLNQTQLVVRYLGLEAWPRALVLDYGLPRSLSLGEVLPQTVFLVALAAAALVCAVRWPKIGFPAATFFLMLAPSSSVVPVVTEVGAERRMYVPSAALCTLAAVGAWYAVRRAAAQWPHRSRTIKTMAISAGAMLVVALSFRTMFRNEEYTSPVALWRTVVERRPQGRAHYGLATALIDAGRHDEAMAELNQAVVDYPDAQYALGTELFGSGQLDAAANALGSFVRAQPTRADRTPARLLLGHVLLAQGKLDEAETAFSALAIATPPATAVREGLTAVGVAHREMATAALQKKDSTALAHARAAVRLLPEDGPARNLLGVALASSGHLPEAVVEFQRALALNPTDPQTRSNLARALGLSGRERTRP